MPSTRASRTRQLLESLESRLLLSGISFAAPRSPEIAKFGTVFLADINNDGATDLIDTSKVGWGLGGGLYDAPVSIAGNFFHGNVIATGDITGDAVADLITYDSNLGQTLPYASNGTKTYGPALQVLFAGNPHAIALGDLNNDNKLDMIVSGGTDISVFINKGDGTFNNPVTSSAFGNGITQIVIADFDDDGFGDIAVPWYVAKGNGDGSFQTPEHSDIPQTAHLAAGDFNGDHKADLVASDPATSVVHVMTGTAGASILTPKNTITVAAGVNVGIAVADFNSDGDDDFAFADIQSVTIYTSKGDATFALGKKVDVSVHNSRLFTGDFNDDGNADFATDDTFIGSNIVVNLHLTFGNGDGTFRKPTVYGTDNTNLLAAGDLNGDGRADIVSTGNGVKFSVRLAQANGTFSAPVGYNINNHTVAAWDAEIKDVSGDGKMDLLLVDGNQNRFAVFLGNGNGTLQNPILYGGPSSGTYSNIVVGDLNKDGKPDLVVGSNEIGNIPGSFASFQVYLNAGGGAFVSNGNYPLTITSWYESLAIGDVDNDGNADIVVGNDHGPSLFIFKGNGAGAFPTSSTFDVTGASGSIGTVITGDFNNDGRTDILMTPSNPNSVFQVALSNVDGSLTLAPKSSQLRNGFSGRDVVVADFNKDGFLDAALIVTDSNNPPWLYDVGVYQNKGDGTFMFGQYFLSAINADTLAAGDFNGDGKADIITSQDVLLNTYTGAPTTTTLDSSDTSSVYGDSITFTATVTSTESDLAGSVQFFAGATPLGAPVALVAGVAQKTISTINAGDYTIRAVFNGGDAFGPSSDTVSQTIVKAPLTVTLDPAARMYNTANPAFTGTIVGKLNNDNITLSIKTTATKTSHPGDYGLTFTFVDPQKKISNYDVISTLANLTITKANQTITWATPADMFVGDALSTKQLNAKVSHPAGGTPNGALTYDHLVGEVLPLGDTVVTVTAAATQDYNQTQASVSIKVKPPGPDLKVTLGAFTPNYTLVPGETIKIPVTLQNTGNQKADASKAIPIQILLRSSDTNVYDPNDPLLTLPILITAPLMPNAKKVTTVLIKLPFNFDPGSFFITTGLIDPNVASDPNLTNNEAATISPFTLARQFGLIPGRKPTAIYSGVDADGTLFKISLAGPGNGQVAINGADIDLTITGTTAATSLNIVTTKSKTPGDDGLVSIHSIFAVFGGATMNMINAATTRITGDVSFGSLNTLSVYSIANAHVASGGIWKTLKVKTDITSSTINGSGLGTITVGGNITDSAFEFNGSSAGGGKIINSFSAGQISNSTFRAVGHIGSIKIAAFVNSSLFLGVLNSVTTLPTSTADFNPNLAVSPILTSLTIGTLTNSVIAAVTIKTTKITAVTDLDGVATPFGFALLNPTVYNGPASSGDFISPLDGVL